jgi:hypothetical protein
MKKYIGLFFFIFFSFTGVSSVSGCVCVPSQGIAKELKASSAVFAGKFIGTEFRKAVASGEVITSHGNTGEKKAVQEVLVLKFQVERWWKGSNTREVKIVTDRMRSSDGSETITDCDFPFEVGKRYLVFTYSDEEGLRTNACTRTKAIEKANEDLKALGRGRKPRKT